MSYSLGEFLSEARISLANPRLGARRVLAMNLPMGARWIGLGIVATISAILFHVALRLMPSDGSEAVVEVAGSPLFTAVLQGVVMLLAAGLMAFVGRQRGGKGSFADALILFCWLQTLMLGLQVGQIAAYILLPPLGEIASFGVMIAFFWLLTCFTMELHGFRSWAAVFGGIIATILGIVLLLTLLGMTLAIWT